MFIKRLKVLIDYTVSVKGTANKYVLRHIVDRCEKSLLYLPQGKELLKKMEHSQRCMGCMEEKGDLETCSHCGFIEGSDALSPQHLKPGTLLQGKYLVGLALGQGGFGITYLGWDINLKLKLAIKEFLPQELASRTAGTTEVSVYTSNSYRDQFEYGLEKFLQEAQTLAQFEGHPNIVSVRDFFRENNTAYIVMSYVEGITLKELLANSGNRMEIEQSLAIIMPVLDALAEVHAVEMLHRDVSPDNIFINRKGQTILIDFGAARQAIGEKGRSLSIILKPGFAPEEQYRSRGQQGPWTDIYAAGITFYRMITGTMPPESLDRLAEDTLIPPSQLGVQIDTDLEDTLMKALAVKAEDRFQTVRDFQNALLGRAEAAASESPPFIPSPPFHPGSAGQDSPPSSGPAEQKSFSVKGAGEAGRVAQPARSKMQKILRGALYTSAGFGILFIILIVVAMLAGDDEPTAETETIFSVPNDYTTIQEAISAVEDGSVIILEPGTYFENVDFQGKELVIKSTDPDDPDIVSSTVVDGGKAGPVFTFKNGEGPEAKIIGLTITGGTGVREQVETSVNGELAIVGEYVGGGLLIMNGSSPGIEKNIIRDNECINPEDDEGAVGGITIFGDSSAVIENNWINGNRSNYGGGILIFYNSGATIRNNTIENNSSLLDSAVDTDIEDHFCGGIVVAYNSTATIENNTIENNTSILNSGGILALFNCDITIKGNTISANNGESIGAGIFIGDNSNARIEFNQISLHTGGELSSGIFLGEFSSAVIRNNTIEDNSADVCGGIIVSDNSTATVNNNTISRNKAQSVGGGILVLERSSATCTENVLEDNEGTLFGGGIAVDYTSSLELDDPDSNNYSGNLPENIQKQ